MNHQKACFYLRRGLFEWLTYPSPAITDPSQRRQARLLSSMLLALLVGSVCIDLIPQWINAHRLDRSLLVLSASIEALGFLYLLSRSHHYPLAAALTVASTSATAFALSFPSEGTNSLVYLIIPVLLSGIFLTTRVTFMLIVLQLVGMIGFQSLFNTSLEERTIELVVVVSALIMLANHYWTLLERDRQAVLAAEHNLLRTVIDHIPDYVCVKDIEGRFLLQNSPTLNLVNTASASQRAHEQTVISSGKPQINCEEVVMDSTGYPHWLLTTRVPMCSHEGKVIGIVGIGRDISARKQAETALTRYIQRLDLFHMIDQSVLAGQPIEEIGRITVEYLEHLLPAACASIILFDWQQEVAQVLAAWSKTEVNLPTGWGLPIDDWKSSETIHYEHLLPDLASISDSVPLYGILLEQGIRTYLSIPLIADDQTWGEMNIGAAAPNAFTPEHLKIAQEMSNQLAVALRSVTLNQRLQLYMTELEERVKQRTTELERAMRRIEAVLNSSSDAILLAYSDGIITQTNFAFDQMFGYPPDGLFHQSLTTIVESEYINIFNQSLTSVVNHGETKQLEIVVRRCNDTAFFAEVGLALVKGEENQRSSVVCSIRDITARKRIEEGLLIALQQERELGALKSRFVSMASHEFRTPLATISSSVDLLQQYMNRMDQAQRDGHFEKLRRSVRYMADMLEDILFLGKAEAKKVPLSTVPLDLETLCQEIMKDFQASVSSNLQLVYESRGNSQAVMLDADLIRHILTNLLSNAVKYSPRGGIVRLDLCYGSDQVIIKVSDQGIGIPKKDQIHMGEPFYRASNVDTISGTGLGLSIAQKAIVLQNGNLIIKSDEGIGTTITVILPIPVGLKNSIRTTFSS